MKIGILGVGHIGKTLALTLPDSGHKVEVANSRGPETIEQAALVTGAEPVTVEQAVKGKDVIILSIPFNRIPEIKPLLAEVPEDVTIIDTSNYYPSRDNNIPAIDEGQVESLWVSEQLGRPIAKAWNAIGYISFEESGKPAGSSDRIAIPIAADRDQDRKITMQLVDETGFDAFDAGSLADSWRQQPGSPVYCTDLSLHEIEELIDTAEKERLPKRRDLAVAAVAERADGEMSSVDNKFLVGLNRVLYIM